MAKNGKREEIGTAGTVTLGAVVGLLAGTVGHLPPAWAAGAGAALAYLWLCWRRPWIPCWRKKCGTTDKEPGRRRAPFGVRRKCWLCGGKRKWLRPGARLLALFGYRPRDVSPTAP